MKTIKKRLAGISLAVIALSLVSFSLSPGMGGDSFEIYLNNHLVVKDYVYGSKGAKNISLQQANYNDELSIKYSHCGKVGNSRSIVLKDGKDRTLKQWTFENSISENNSMNCHVKDIIDLKKNNGGVLKLVYSSKELSSGQVLAFII
jgi:hypothetical protein